MATKRQVLGGSEGILLPEIDRAGALKRLPPNFKSAAL